MLKINFNATAARGLVPRRLKLATTDYKKKKLLLTLPKIKQKGEKDEKKNKYNIGSSRINGVNDEFRS